MLGCGLVPMSPGGLHSQGPDEGPARDDQVVATTKAVLLVEDEPAIALSLGDALREEGLAVATAQNGLEALQLLRNGLRPSVILLDLMMPVMDGASFREAQRRDPRLAAIPVVVLSAGG